MEITDRGANGAHAVKHVKKDGNQEHVNVIHLLLSTVEWIAQEIQIKTKFATGKFRAQVFARLCNAILLGRVTKKENNIFLHRFAHRKDMSLIIRKPSQ